METIIKIGYNEGIFDATGEGVKKDILDLGIKGVKSVSIDQLYLIKGDPEKKDLGFIAENILCDPIVQSYEIISRHEGRAPAAGGKCFAVEVWFKKGVTDNVGQSVKKAIDDLRIAGVTEVQSGRKFRLEGKIKKPEIINITTRLLASEVVEDYKIYEES